MKPKVLIVDDEVDNLDALERLFRKKYDVLRSTNGKEALELLKTQAVAVIVSDQRMPQMTGVEFLEESIRLRPEATRLLLTGYTDIESVIAAVNAGQIYRYVTKPWEPQELLSAVDRAFDHFRLNEELKTKNSELTQALDELRTLDTAKNHFMVLINHELKTPLTTLLSFLELLNETKLDSDQKNYISRIQISADRIREIILDVLELMSAETGQTPLKASRLELEPMVQDLIASNTKTLNQRNLKVKSKIDVKAVSADSTIIRQVLNRLFSNAVKFADSDSEIKITVTESHKCAHIEISNQGEPVPEDTLHRILKPFTLNENILNHSKGIGLGLSVCQALLTHHESELHLHCHGRTFRAAFKLPSAK